MTASLSLQATCIRCTSTATGRTGDPPANRRHGSRWAELDASAEAHTRTTGHPTRVSATPQPED